MSRRRREGAKANGPLVSTPAAHPAPALMLSGYHPKEPVHRPSPHVVQLSMSSRVSALLITRKEPLVFQAGIQEQPKRR